MSAASVLRRRCPRCGRGRVFAGLYRMHAKCSECGLGFFPEPGYYVGAMYFSYAMALAIGTPVFLGLLAAGVPYWWCAGVTGGVLAMLSPLLFQYSRVIWMHFERSLNW